jgi:hypothetical protein
VLLGLLALRCASARIEPGAVQAAGKCLLHLPAERGRRMQCCTQAFDQLKFTAVHSD